MASPTSSVSHGCHALDLSSLARVTSKTFERLAPYTLMQNPSLPEAKPEVKKVIHKVQAYIGAIDTSIHVIHIAYQMSKIAGALWTHPAPLNEKVAERIQLQRQNSLKELVILADEMHQKAQKTTAVFKQAQQDFYRIAASTKDIDCTVQIPADPTLPNLILKKSLKDIGPDLVSNLNLLADFTRHSSDFTAWCGWIKSSIITIDSNTTVVVLSQDGSLVDADIIRPKWDRIRADCLIYHSIISEILGRYNSMLPISSDIWCATIRNTGTKTATDTDRDIKRRPKSSRTVSSLLHDAVCHLSCHTQSHFAI